MQCHIRPLYAKEWSRLRILKPTFLSQIEAVSQGASGGESAAALRVLVAEAPNGELMGMVAVTLPGARLYHFEARQSFASSGVPTQDRSQLGEAHHLYIGPDHGSEGLARLLSVLPLVYAWAHGARYVAMDGAMIPAAISGFGPGVQPDEGETAGVTVGVVARLLNRLWPQIVQSLQAPGSSVTFSPEVLEMVQAWTFRQPVVDVAA